ncbi:MAG: hypothetical protein V1897_15565 [Pseudomonadota bacterium]
MRWVMVSGIFGNLVALNSVFKSIHSLEPYQLYCLGNVVGPDLPQECLHRLQDEANLILCGEFDMLVAGLIENVEECPMEVLSEVEQTREMLDEDNLDTLANCPVEYLDDQIRYVHCLPTMPFSFFDPKTRDEVANKVFGVTKDRVIFSGHGLKQGVVGVNGNGEILNWQKLDLKKRVLNLEIDKRYFIQVGSVGKQERKACFAVYDDEVEIVQFWEKIY